MASKSHLGASVGDEFVIMSVDRGEYYGLSGIGPRIWELIKEPTSIELVVQGIMAEYNIDEATCTADVRDFIDRLVDAGLVDCV